MYRLGARVGSRKVSRFLSTVPTRPIQLFQFDTLVELQQKATAAYTTNPMFGTKVGNAFEWTTYSEFDVEVSKCRIALAEHHISKNDKIAIISNNRLEWAVIKYAANGLGSQIIPMYEAQMEKDWTYILEDSDAKVLIVATEAIYEKVKNYPGKIGKVESIICLDASVDKPYSYKHWMQKAVTKAQVPARTDITADDISTIIYTSGTTGKPKGVELSHRNVCGVIHGTNDLYRKYDAEFLEHQVSLAYLPWAHVYGMTCEVHQLTSTGSARAIVPSREQILECLQLSKPTCIISVPVLFNRVYDSIMKGISEQSAFRQKLVHYALSVSRERNANLEFGRSVSPFLAWKHNLLDKVIFSKIREKLGGRLKYMAAGGAATSLPVLQFFEDIGIPIMEGYGLTETSPIVTAGTVSWENRRLGCVGVPIPGVKVRIMDPETLQEMPSDTDGEITCSGPVVMTGYRKNQKANDEVFYQHEGARYFRTGDMGRMVEGKFLKITGRIKEQFKLENGKYVVPAPLEDVFTRSPYILQLFICGTNHPHPIALVVPNWANLLPWCEKKGLSGKAPTAAQLADTSLEKLDIFDEPAFRDLINQEMARVGAGLKSYEKPGQWLPLTQAFTQENQMMTPKMSLRRTVISAVHKDKIEALYANKGCAVKY